MRHKTVKVPFYIVLDLENHKRVCFTRNREEALNKYLKCQDENGKTFKTLFSEEQKYKLYFIMKEVS